MRTIVDLRTPDGRDERVHEAPSSVGTVRVPLEAELMEDPQFCEWAKKGWLSTPLYYPKFVERWPDRCAEAVAAVAGAEPAVVVHCGAGRDRTGLVVGLLLSLVGVPAGEIASDHELSAERLGDEAVEALGIASDAERIEEVLEREGTSMRRALLDFFGPLDAERVLRDGGLGDGQLRAVRRLLLEE